MDSRWRFHDTGMKRLTDCLSEGIAAQVVARATGQAPGRILKIAEEAQAVAHVTHDMSIEKTGTRRAA